jgi:hypothetical protein
VKLEHHELSSALVEFLAAKRNLRQAYRISESSHTPTKVNAMLQVRAADHIGIDAVTPEQMQKLKNENERLRKLAALLYAYSLSVHDELDAVSSPNERRSVASQLRRNC